MIYGCRRSFQRKTSILAVSTALGEDNFFSGMTQLRDLDTGELIFNVVRIGQICKKCRAGDASWLCTHKNYLLPAWKSSKKTARMKAFYGEGNEHMHLREILGEIADAGKGALPSALITRFAALPHYQVKYPAKAIYFCIDPSGGGAGEMGMCAFVDYDAYFVIVCLGSVSIRGQRSDKREREAVLGIIARLRAKPHFRDAPIIMMVEAAPSIAASHIYGHVINEPNICFMFESSGNREGCPKSNESTNLMKVEIEQMLEQDLVRFAADGITYDHEMTFGEGDGGPSQPARTFEQEKAKLIKQMRNLRYEALKKTDQSADQKYKLTGKNGSEQDDLLVSFMMGSYWKRRFWSSSNPRYSETKKRIRERFYPNSGQ